MDWFKKMLGLKNSRDEGAGRRNRERAEVKLPFGLEVADNRLVGMTLDISMKGALLQVEEGTTLSPELAGQVGIIRIMLPKGEFRADCKITRVEWSSIALEFPRLKDNEDHVTLLDYLETQLGDVW